MKRRSYVPNRKLLKKNVTGSERSKREGPWRVKDQKSGTYKHKNRQRIT